jgi:hypothetical protein
VRRYDIIDVLERVLTKGVIIGTQERLSEADEGVVWVPVTIAAVNVLRVEVRLSWRYLASGADEETRKK